MKFSKVQRARLAKGMTGNTLAMMTGLSRPQIYRIETGERKPRADERAKISIALDKPEAVLFGN